MYGEGESLYYSICLLYCPQRGCLLPFPHPCLGIFLSKLTCLPSTPNQTWCWSISSSCPCIHGFLWCLGIHSSCLGQVGGYTFKRTFSFLPTSCTSTLRCTHLPSQADNHHLPLGYLSSLSLPSQTLGPSKPHSKDPPFLFQN